MWFAAIGSFYLLFLIDTRSTAISLVDGHSHVQYEHIARIQKGFGRWNLQSATDYLPLIKITVFT